MNSRDAILQRIRAELTKHPPLAAPEAAEVWHRENPSPEILAERFTDELTAVGGEVIRCDSAEEAARRLAQLAVESQWTSIGAIDRPIVRRIGASLPPDTMHWRSDDWQPAAIAHFSAGLIEPEVLMADTGSCLIACPTAQDRLLCYLPPVCVVVARKAQLTEHLPAAWPRVTSRLGELPSGGELVIVTGPSRTADIEKTLILGVHGPKRLVVILL